MTTLSGIAVGAAAAGITGASIGMGTLKIEAKRYEGKIQDGNLLISVRTDNSGIVASVTRIFESARATHTLTGSGASLPDGGTPTMKPEIHATLGTTPP